MTSYPSSISANEDSQAYKKSVKQKYFFLFWLRIRDFRSESHLSLTSSREKNIKLFPGTVFFLYTCSKIIVV